MPEYIRCPYCNVAMTHREPAPPPDPTGDRVASPRTLPYWECPRCGHQEPDRRPAS